MDDISVDPTAGDSEPSDRFTQPVSLDAVLTTDELKRRVSRPANYEAESRAFAELTLAMADAQVTPNAGSPKDAQAPFGVLQRLVEITMRLCDAHSCGISILEHDHGEEVFRWHAVAGDWSRFLGGCMPRNASPCGVVLARDVPLLMSRPERHFLYASPDVPPLVEVLLVPFHSAGRAIGTLWIIAHDETRKFDAEDLRLVTNFSRFAALAHHWMEEREQRQLHALSTLLVEGGEPDLLYERALDIAMAIMHSDFGSIQIAVDQNGSGESIRELELLVSRGFHPESERAWKRIGFDSTTSCGAAFRDSRRFIIGDVEDSEFVVEKSHLDEFRRSGIRSVQSTPLISRAGKLLGMISTHWRRPHHSTSSEFRALDVLARQVADFIERTRAEAALREADRRKDEFLATLAHELRNPLAPLRYALSLMEISDEEPASFVEVRQMMQRQLQQLVRLIDDLLDIGRINCGKIELRKERVLLSDIVALAVESVKPLFDETGQQVSITLPATPISLIADAARLAQVFANLLSNAAKYTEAGAQIQLIAERQGSEVAISVVDTGIGIAHEHLGRVFELFSQVDSALKRSKGGLGIGLALVRGLVVNHGGTVEAQSDGLGRGSRFVVRLPVVDLVVEEPVTDDHDPPQRPAKSRILVVDDNVDAATSLSLLLSVKGHEVQTAHDGVAAVELAASFRPQVVLLDIGMPRMNGYEAAQEIRTRDWGRLMTLVAMTGWGQSDDKRRAVEAGFDHHLTKPADPTALDRVLEVVETQSRSSS